MAPFREGEPIARLTTPLRLEYATTGADSLLYVLGGRPALNGWHTGFSKPATWEVFSRTDVYDPADNSWRQLASMPIPRYGFATGSIRSPQSGQVRRFEQTGRQARQEAVTGVLWVPGVAVAGGGGGGLRDGRGGSE